MNIIRLKQLAGLLTESKKRINEEPLMSSSSSSNIDINRSWRNLNMSKAPIDMTPEEIDAEIEEFDSRISDLNKTIQEFESAKEQLSSMKDQASTAVSQYGGKKLSPRDISDFLSSIFIEDSSYKQEMFKIYNNTVKKQTSNDAADGYTTDELLLSSPNELVAKRSFPKGGSQVDFLYTRSNGGNIVEPALRDAVERLLDKHYPELNNMVYVVSPSSARGSKWIKKNYILRVKRSSMSSTGKAWRGIFSKYAEWK
jgi:hypothetical protein